MKSDKPVKILLVDDHTENLFALELIFSDDNYLCVRANSGKEAVNILSNDIVYKVYDTYELFTKK